MRDSESSSCANPDIPSDNQARAVPPGMVALESVDEQIYRLPKSSLRDGAGRAYPEFKRGLAPRYFVVWRDIAFGYLALASWMGGLLLVQRVAPAWVTLLCLPVGALLLGFTLAFLNLFFHEAAHWNLARHRTANDVLANLFIGTPFGQSIEAYRVVHFGHHQHHGTPADSEHSYFDPLDVRFMAGSLLGVRAFRVALDRDRFAGGTGPAPKTASRLALLRGLLFNGMLLGACVWLGGWAPALSWIAGLAGVFPFFNAVRQVLEHRDELADTSVNYAEVAHGRINRLFGDSLLAQTLGGAGFNRHLLHHWEPQVSYTRLAELEAFVLDTEYGGLFRQRQTTYSRTFLRLLQQRAR